MKIGDKIKCRMESFLGKTIGYKIGIVVAVRPYLNTRQYVLFCITGATGPDGKEKKPNYIGEVHDIYPHGREDDIEILENGCSVEGLNVTPFWEEKKETKVHQLEVNLTVKKMKSQLELF